MKKLAIYIPSIESGGVEKNLYCISNFFLKKGIEVYIVTANNDKKKFFNKKIKYICPKNHKWNNSSRLLKTIMSLYLIILKLPKKNISIFAFQSNISAIILARIFNLKIIIRLNTSINKYIKGLIKKSIFKIFYGLANKIIVNSFQFKKDLKRFLNLKSTTIFNPTNTKKKYEKKRINYFLNFRGIKILSIGRITDQKDQITILKSLKILMTKQINFRFFLIGQGDKLNELKKYVQDNNLSKNVKFGGYKKDAYKYIRSSDIFVLSSKFEGLPNVLIEAQTQNVPIISSDCLTGPREILLSGKLGYLFGVGDYVSLSKKIINFSKDKKIFLQKARLSNKYLYRYDYTKNLNKYYKTIKTII